MRAVIARATFALVLCLSTQTVLARTVEVYRPPAEAVASAHPIATQAGLDVLAAGGNAFDAAVAVAATLAVVEPYGSGIGGGGFFLLHRNGADLNVMIDARETAPGAATGDMYLDADGKPVEDLSRDGPLAAGIPGIPAALDHITKSFGVRSIEENLAPAIRAAREGFPVNEKLAGRITASAHRFSPAAKAVFLPGGMLPSVGDRLKQEDLAQTLEQIARKGREGFYEGPLAKKLQQGAYRDGGIWSLEDLADYRIKEREPTTIQYRGYEITTASLPSAGGVTLSQVFNILEARDWPPAGDTAARHELIEAMRLAYRDRAIYLGDPDFVDVPVERLTSEAYAQELAKRIGPKALDSDDLEVASLQAARARGENTTHFSILDRDGNRVSATLSINTWFGSGYMAPGTGVLFNNEMDDFATAPLVPNAYGLVHTEANAVQPHKRPLSSMSPTFVEGPRGVFITGTPGGSRIITMVLLSSLAHMNGLNAQQAVTAPRFHHQFLPDAVYFEPAALTEDQQAALRARGHELHSSSRRYGDMQAIHWNIRYDTVEAASDPRGIGSANVRATRKD
ncbi:gamma-glutamyltransferase [Algiphilus sp. NNCM1]|nr:gamma-glutamyltransferase [Algiphilus acroporae]